MYSIWKNIPKFDNLVTNLKLISIQIRNIFGNYNFNIRNKYVCVHVVVHLSLRINKNDNQKPAGKNKDKKSSCNFDIISQQ